MDDLLLNPVFKISEPKTVWYCDRPLKSPGAVSRKISVAELEKIIGGEFRYSENIYHTITAKLPFTKNSRLPEVVKDVLERVKNPLTDKLVICKIDDEVGHGIFARQPIRFNAIVAIYTGEIRVDAKIDDPAYVLDAALSVSSSGYSVDAKKVGGIARFFQHFPYHADILAEYRAKEFKKGKACIKRCLDLDGTLSDLEPVVAEASIDFFLNDALNGGGQGIKESMTEQLDPNGCFEVKNTTLSVSWHEIAIANLGMSSLILQEGGLPLIYFYAEKAIQVGDPMGFSYTLGYWASKSRLPFLFDLCGNTLSRDLYQYTKMPFSVEEKKGHPKAFFYSRKQYDADKLKQNPVNLFPGSPQKAGNTMSFFNTRKILAENNVVSITHLPRYPNEFVLNLKKLLSEDVVIEIYEHDPDSPHEEERYIFDVVCRAPSLKRWEQLVVFLCQDPIIGKHCVQLSKTQEIIINSVNVYTQDMHKFIKSKIGSAELSYKK